jgi:phosphatidylserine/phosphatidylglycerophosphate/cardiolipin synthase-like enzyme
MGRPNGSPSYRNDAKISQVCYAPTDSGEFVEFANCGGDSIDLYGWQVTDFDGILSFPPGFVIPPGGSMKVAENATKYWAKFGVWPDFQYANMTSLDGGFGLANSGDEVSLLDPWGMSADLYAYGGSTYIGPGWDGVPATTLAAGKISTRDSMGGLWADTNSSADWDVAREYEPGQSSLRAAAFDTCNLTVMAFPDAGSGAVMDLIDEAAGEILLNMYEFKIQEAADALSAAAQRGVNISVLLEGEPVGGFSSTTAELCDQMSDAGAVVRLMTSRGGTREAYRFDHAKYMVVDGKALFVSTENWSPNGLPREGLTGNRGWAAVVREDGVASHFADVFSGDWNNFAVPWAEVKDQISVVEPSPSQESAPLRRIFSPANVTTVSRIRPVFSPDTSTTNETIIGAIRSARSEICVEQMSIYRDWNHYANGVLVSQPNPFLEELLGAARRGVGVRVLADSTSYGGEACVNGPAVTYLNTMAALESLNLSAKLVSPEPHGFVKIHAKGMVVDGYTTLVSSINWGRNSAMENREAGIIIESAQAGAYFRSVFDYDWRDDVEAPVARISAPSEAIANYSVEISANSSSDDVGIVSHEWVIDGRNVASHDASLLWTFAMEGNHTILLTVSDEWGNENTTRHTVLVKPSESCLGTDPANTSAAVTIDADATQGSGNETASNGDSAGSGAGIGFGMLLALSVPGVALVVGWGFSAMASKRRSKARHDGCANGPPCHEHGEGAIGGEGE